MALDIRPLTQEQRQAAYRAAQAAVVRAVGPQPAREHFTHTTISKYPPAITCLISSLCVVLLLAAFTPSAIRLYVIGSHTFGLAVPNHLSQTAVGLATVLSAEVGQVVFSLALATLGTSPSSRRLLHGSMGIATIVALTGNIQVSLLGHTDSPFAWLGSMAPPILVLSTAYVLKEQALGAIEMRHANEQAYQATLALWQAATAHPEEHSHWQQFFANALRDALRKTNSRRQETLSQMIQDDWRVAVTREMRADGWYMNASPDEDTLLSYVPGESVLIPGRNGHGPFPKATVAAG
jgi:hypothetical protein